MTQGNRLPTYFLSHGGGPWPYMKEDLGNMYDKLEKSLKQIGSAHSASKPAAILVVTAHHEERAFTLSSHPNPPMLYDYGGFPAHTYKVKYSAPGSPELANRIKDMLEAAGFPAQLDAKRGYDHGTFVPMYVMFPEADIPIVQMSIRSDYDPEAHYRAGQALASLRDENILIVGSGLTFHNLPLIFNPRAKSTIKHASREFDDWLQETLKLEPEERFNRLKQWRKAPSATVAHPPSGEDHFIPLFVALGAASEEPTTVVHYENDSFGSATVSGFRFA